MRNYGKKKWGYQLTNPFFHFEDSLNIYTIGFTKKSARDFFKILQKSGAKHLLDIRLNNVSQLAGFTKKNDLPYFLKHLINMEYHEVPGLAPNKIILDEYRKTKDWNKYEKSYLLLIQNRKAEKQIPPNLFEEGIVLLCSEPKPEHCHRRLAAEYLAKIMPNGLTKQIVHL
jgi:uncharacterized protein (DUF488 family)